jgi:hypothetical protein
MGTPPVWRRDRRPPRHSASEAAPRARAPLQPCRRRAVSAAPSPPRRHRKASTACVDVLLLSPPRRRSARDISLRAQPTLERAQREKQCQRPPLRGRLGSSGVHAAPVPRSVPSTAAARRRLSPGSMPLCRPRSPSCSLLPSLHSLPLAFPALQRQQRRAPLHAWTAPSSHACMHVQPPAARPHTLCSLLRSWPSFLRSSISQTAAVRAHSVSRPLISPQALDGQTRAVIGWRASMH